MVTGVVEKQKEKTVICRHVEEISTNGKKGVCTLCDQEREYDLIHPKEPPVVTKRGRIDGVLTEIVPPPVDEEPKPVPGVNKVIAGKNIKEKKSEALAPCAPADWKTWSKRQKHDWLEKYWESIIIDLKTIGVYATARKWNLSDDTLRVRASREHITVKQTKSGPRQGAKRQAKAIRHGRVVKPRKKRLGASGATPAPFPPFPAFNESWLAPVKIAWFEAYVKIFVEGRLINERNKKGS